MASRYYLNDRLDDAIVCSDILSLPETVNISPGALLVRRVLGAVAQFDKAMTVEPDRINIRKRSSTGSEVTRRGTP